MPPSSPPVGLTGVCDGQRSTSFIHPTRPLRPRLLDSSARMLHCPAFPPISGWVGESLPIRFMVKERSITDRIMLLLGAVPKSFVRKMHGNRMQGGGIPDIFFTCDKLEGRSVWIEVKRPGGVRTPLQVHIGQRLERSGCAVLEVHSVEEVSSWLKDMGVTVVTRSRVSDTRTQIREG